MMNHLSSRPSGWGGTTVSWGVLTKSFMVASGSARLHPQGGEGMVEHPVHGPQVHAYEHRDDHDRVGGTQDLFFTGPVHPVEFREQILGLLLDGADHVGPRGKDSVRKTWPRAGSPGPGRWQGRQASNPRPADLESAALPTELLPCGTTRLLVEPGGKPLDRRPTWSRGESYTRHRS